MRIRNFVIAAAVLSLAIPGFANATSGTDRATGGGQTLLSTQGAGNTIAFTAQGNEDVAKGQVQFIDRAAGRGRDQVKFHGIVRCLLVNANRAQISGVNRDTGQPFELTVVDNGEGAAAPDDAILFDTTDVDGNCATDDSDNTEEPDLALARGNAQVHDAP